MCLSNVVERKEPLVVMCPKCRRILFKGSKASISIKCDKCHSNWVILIKHNKLQIFPERRVEVAKVNA